MKILLLLSFSFLCTISAFSQDVIFTKSGDKIEAKVVEITSTTIKYKNFDQQDGPVRNIEKSEVKEIIYEDGQWDKFDEKEKEAKTEEKKVEPKKEVYRERETEDNILNKGFFLDGMICYNMSTEIQESSYDVYDEYGNYSYTVTNLYTENNTYFGLNVRLGSKWYFGASDSWRPGIQATWARIGVFIPEDIGSTSPKFTLSLLNIGFANAIKFNESNGMEMNLNVGFSMNGIPLPTASNNNLQLGVIFGADIKYRYKSFAVGFDFSRINLESPNGRSSKMNVPAVTVGFKM